MPGVARPHGQHANRGDGDTGADAWSGCVALSRNEPSSLLPYGRLTKAARLSVGPVRAVRRSHRAFGGLHQLPAPTRHVAVQVGFRHAQLPADVASGQFTRTDHASDSAYAHVQPLCDNWQAQHLGSFQVSPPRVMEGRHGQQKTRSGALVRAALPGSRCLQLWPCLNERTQPKRQWQPKLPKWTHLERRTHPGPTCVTRSRLWSGALNRAVSPGQTADLVTVGNG